jgi:hypothetical protein
MFLGLTPRTTLNALLGTQESNTRKSKKLIDVEERRLKKEERAALLLEEEKSNAALEEARFKNEKAKRGAKASAKAALSKVRVGASGVAIEVEEDLVKVRRGRPGEVEI